MTKTAAVAALALVLLTPGCNTPAKQLEGMYERDSASATKKEGLGAVQQSQARRFDRHIRTVRKFAEKDQIQTADDHVHAAYILCFSSKLEDLELAEELGIRAAELGDDRGFRLAAEAVDRQCVMLQIPQHYGTQFVYDKVLRKWRLYPVDPRTTDIERQGWGVEPMHVLREREEILNEAPQLKIFREDQEPKEPELSLDD